jgi:ABC-2 type transport system permease protein
MKTYSWLVRREFWENRAIWMIPAVVGGLLTVAALFGRVDLDAFASQAQGHTLGGMYLVALGAMFYVVMSIYSSWYLMDCLYADRRDRSILFWKSLPVSDTQTVLSKLAVALVAIPVVYFIASDVTALITAFIISVRAGTTIGGSLWQVELWFQVQVLWAYAIVTTAIWYLPVAGWLLLVSAWAKRAVMLWTVLPLLVLYIIERWFLGSNVIGHVLGRRLMGYGMVAFRGQSEWATSTIGDEGAKLPFSVWHFINAGGFLSNMETWIGVAVGVAMIAGAIQLRTRRAAEI